MSDPTGNGTTSPHGDTAVAELGRELYERALVRREDENITDPSGQPIGWLLDTRMALMEGDLFQEVGSVIARELTDRGVQQVTGFGFGAYPVVCSVLASDAGRQFNGGLIRPQRKPYGRKRLVEGAVDPEMPVVLLDDILNSGRSAEKAIGLLEREDYSVSGLFTLFNFTWGGGKSRILTQGLWVDTLLNLNLRDEDRSPSTQSDSMGRE